MADPHRTGFPIAPVYLPKDRGPQHFIDLAKTMKSPALTVRDWKGFQLHRYVSPAGSSLTHDPIGHLRISVQIAGVSRIDRHMAGQKELGIRSPGTISVTPPGEAASWVWQDPMDLIMLFIPGNLLCEVACEDGGIDIEKIALEVPLAAEDLLLTETAKVLLENSQAPLHDMVWATASRFVAAHVLNRYGRGMMRKSFTKGGLSPSQLRRVMEHLRGRLSEDLQLEELSALVDLSPSHFCRAFKTSTGLPPHRWQIVQRINYAKTLLARSQMSLTDIASACGYTEHSNFNRAFRRVTGVTPGEFRHNRRS